jgi:hypothetical protein
MLTRYGFVRHSKDRNMFLPDCLRMEFPIPIAQTESPKHWASIDGRKNGYETIEIERVVLGSTIMYCFAVRRGSSLFFR